MPRPLCRVCARSTTPNKYLERDHMCATCFHLSKLEPFDDTKAEAYVLRLRRQQHLRWDQVLSQVRRIMRPPPIGQWMLHHVVELDSRTFWPWAE